MPHSSPGMIVKEFINAKTFRAYSANFLRQDKSLRDHGRTGGGVEMVEGNWTAVTGIIRDHGG
jgi:hypothetical protein